MDFWCHASALFALSWARACDLIRAAHARGGLRQQLCARRERTAVSQSTERHRGEQHLR